MKTQKSAGSKHQFHTPSGALKQILVTLFCRGLIGRRTTQKLINLFGLGAA